MTLDKSFYTSEFMNKLKMNDEPVEAAIMSAFDRSIILLLFAGFLNKADDNHQLLNNFFEQSKDILLSTFDETFKNNQIGDNIVHDIFKDATETADKRSQYEAIINSVVDRYKLAIEELFKFI